MNLRTMTILIFSAISMVIGIGLGCRISQSEIDSLRNTVDSIKPYKEAFMNHADKCDTLHQHCFKSK